MIQKNFSLERAQSLALLNLSDLPTIFEWNAQHDIHPFRLSSDLFPHMTNIDLPEVKDGTYTLDFADDLLKRVGESAKTHHQRIGLHPGQFNQLATPREDVWEATVRDLSYQADLLDRMGAPEESRLCIHGGGVYGDLEKTKRRWIERFHLLPAAVRRRLAIENCERCYSVVDVIEMAEACRIPVIFDTHHHECYNQLHPDRQSAIGDWMDLIIQSWGGLTPLFHVSEQAPGERVGTHAEYVQQLPAYLHKVVEQYGSIDIEIESGAKEKNVLSLRDVVSNK